MANKRVGDVIYDNFDQYTGQPFNTKILTELPDGTVITDALVDNAVIFKNKPEHGGGYSVRSEFLDSGVVKSSWYGTKGDGITDDTEAIQQLFDKISVLGISKVIFPKGLYPFSAKLTVSGASNFTIDFQDSELFDKCKDSFSTTNTAIKIPVGIEFSNCTNFKVLNLQHDSAVPLGSHQIREDLKAERVPHIAFNTCSKYEVNGLKMKGLVGAGVALATSASAKEFLSASYLRNSNCSELRVTNSEIVKGAGGGEFFTFVDSNDITWDNCSHVQAGDTLTFWSFGKVIACNNTSIYNHTIQSNSTGSLFDWCGDGLQVYNMHVDYPLGKFMDFAGEWGDAFTEAKNVSVRNCSTNGTGLLLSTAIGTSPDIDNVTIDDLELRGENSATFYNRIYGVDNILIKNTSYRNKLDLLTYISPASGFDFHRDATLENVKIYCDETFAQNSTNLQTAGTLTLDNCEVDMLGKRITFTDTYSSSFNLPLPDSDYLVVVRNTSFSNTILDLHANVEFYNCTFYNCRFTSRASTNTNRISPRVLLEGCTFEYISTDTSITTTGVIFQFLTMGDLELRNCRLFGETASDGAQPMLVYDRDAVGDILIQDTSIKVARRLAGNLTDLIAFIYSLNHADSSARSITVKNSITDFVTNLIRITGPVIAVPVDFISLTIENHTHLTNGTLIRLDAGHSATRHNISGYGVRCISAINPLATDFASFNLISEVTTTSVTNPNGNSIGSVGSIFRSGNSNMYLKKTGDGNTGWVKLLDTPSAAIANINIGTVTTIEEANTAIQALVTAFNAKLQADRNSGQQAT